MPPHRRAVDEPERRRCRPPPRRRRAPPPPPSTGASPQSRVQGVKEYVEVGAGHSVPTIPGRRHVRRCRANSPTLRLPALVCRRSTFCVMTPVTTPARSSPGERPVAVIGRGGVHMPPTEVVACPIPLPEYRVGLELADRHWVAGRRIGSAIVGDSGILVDMPAPVSTATRRPVSSSGSSRACTLSREAR